ncbi:MAG: serine protease [Lachnospiraceae bacterium]
MVIGMKKNVILASSIAVLLVLAGIFLLQEEEDTLETISTVPLQEEGVTRISTEEVGTDRYVLEDEIIAMMGRECVQVVAGEDVTASGVIYACDNDTMVILTAGHVLEEATEGTICLFDNTEIAFGQEEFEVLEALDVAVIYVENETNFQLGHSGAKAFMDFEAMIGERIWMLESSIYPVCDIVDGIVGAVDFYLSDYETEMLVVYAEGRLGISGSPIYDEEGFLLGIVSGMNESGDILSVVPIEAITNELE